MKTPAAAPGASFAEQIERLLAEGRIELPPLPDIALRLQKLMADDRADTRKVSALLESEPAIAASILRIANSAAYAGLQAITDLTQGIARLGLHETHAVVTALSVKGQFENDSAEKSKILQKLWEHSVATASAARAIARRIGLEPETAFLAGLLHDCGKLVVLKAVDHIEAEKMGPAPTRPVLDELMRVLHPKLGSALLVAWNLPAEMAEVALKHEDVNEQTEDSLLLCVQASNVITRKLGYHPAPDPDIPLLQEPAVESLGLDDLALAALMVDLDEEIDRMRKLF